MSARRLLFSQLFLAIAVYASQTIGIYHFELDANSSYFALTHFLAGMFVAHVVAWLDVRAGRSPSLVRSIGAAFAVGIAWELFEVMADLTLVSSPNYPVDTISDLIMDSAGGLCSQLVIVSTKLFKNG